LKHVVTAQYKCTRKLINQKNEILFGWQYLSLYNLINKQACNVIVLNASIDVDVGEDQPN
jgi:hypothetical protein